MEKNVKDPNKSVGRFKFCVNGNSSGSWFGSADQYKIEFKMVVGENIKEISEYAKSHQYDEMQVHAFDLLEKTRHFMKVEDLNREIENEVFEGNEALMNDVVTCTVVQTVIILVTGIIQITTLRRFLLEKRFLNNN